jgi:hypothetical protein
MRLTMLVITTILVTTMIQSLTLTTITQWQQAYAQTKTEGGGFVFKLEISIGDIAAIAALIASPLIFWVGYSRTRKSEQIKISREHMDRLDAGYKRFEEDFKGLEAKFGKSSEDFTPVPGQVQTNAGQLEEYLKRLNDITREIDYFDHLVTSHEVLDKNVLSYYAPRMTNTLEILISKLNRIQEMKDRGVSDETSKKAGQMKTYLDNKNDIWKRRGSVRRGSAVLALDR